MSDSPPRTVTVHRKLRPVRLAFLVRPNDALTLRRILEACTCLWGGQFNAIIPYMTRLPGWWSRGVPRPRSAKRAVAGYLRAFDPDFAVVPDSLKGALGSLLPTDRILGLDEVLPTTGEPRVGCGLGVSAVYAFVHDRELRFVQRRAPRVVLPRFSAPPLELLSAATFGRHPDDARTNSFRSVFGRLSPKTVKVTAKNFLGLLDSRPWTPLTLGAATLEWQRRGWVRGPYLFLMHGAEPRDVIDYWNLRAFGEEVYPVPVEWGDTSLDAVNAFVRSAFRPGTPPSPHESVTTLLKSRSLDDGSFSAFAKKVKSPASGALLTQNWYPPLWEAWGHELDMVERGSRCEVRAASDTIERTVSDGLLRFKTLAPECRGSGPSSLKPQWVNIVRLDDDRPSPDAAPVIPPRLPDATEVLGTMGGHEVWIGEEGIVVPCKYAEDIQHWLPPSADAVMRATFASHGLKATPSDAGTTAREVLRALGRPSGAALIAHPDVLKLLRDMAHAEIETVRPDGQSPAVTRVRSRAIERAALIQRLQLANDKSLERSMRHLQALVAHGVLRVGLSVRCPFCARTNFFPPSTIKDELSCERCLRAFPFPAAQVDTTTWSYRTQGAFAVENYAQGGLVVALCLRFLADPWHSEATWTTGLRLTDSKGNEQEVDLAAWLRGGGLSRDHWPSFVVGECKSLAGLFERKELLRARALAERIPGVTLVFATLRASLEKREKERLIALARWGRGFVRGDEWRAPVIVLTARELLSRDHAPYCWKEIGDRYRGIEQLHHMLRGTRGLAAVTQELYLGMTYAEEERRRESRMLNRLQARRSRPPEEHRPQIERAP